jgi:hypothetical protein
LNAFRADFLQVAFRFPVVQRADVRAGCFRSWHVVRERFLPGHTPLAKGVGVLCTNSCRVGVVLRPSYSLGIDSISSVQFYFSGTCQQRRCCQARAEGWFRRVQRCSKVPAPCSAGCGSNSRGGWRRCFTSQSWKPSSLPGAQGLGRLSLPPSSMPSGPIQ